MVTTMVTLLKSQSKSSIPWKVTIIASFMQRHPGCDKTKAIKTNVYISL